MNSTSSGESIASMIDHALLNPILSDSEMDEGCRVAREFNVASVCIKPYYLKRCAELLKGSTVQPSTVIGFPHGGHTLSVKMAEAQQAFEDGCTEYDMVVNVGKVWGEDWNYVREEIQTLTQFVHEKKGLIKVIFENSYLKEVHKLKLCNLCAELGIDFAKTSTGFASSGATLDDAKLMIKSLPSSVKVKVSGGIQTLDQLLEYRKLGVSRIGTSRTVAILKEFEDRNSSSSVK
jgi:deoxyribose-phosphate aldolase